MRRAGRAGSASLMRCAHLQRHIPSFTRGRRLPRVHRLPHSRLPAHRTMSITAINVRNQFRGKIKEIIEGPVVSEIDVETPSGLIVTSVITTRSVKDLKLAVGREVIALVKSTEVSIAAL